MVPFGLGFYRMGPRDSSVAVEKWLNSMVYGRYNYNIHGGFLMVYKPTNIYDFSSRSHYLII